MSISTVDEARIEVKDKDKDAKRMEKRRAKRNARKMAQFNDHFYEAQLAVEAAIDHNDWYNSPTVGELESRHIAEISYKNKNPFADLAALWRTLSDKGFELKQHPEPGIICSAYFVHKKHNVAEANHMEVMVLVNGNKHTIFLDAEIDLREDEEAVS